MNEMRLRTDGHTAAGRLTGTTYGRPARRGRGAGHDRIPRRQRVCGWRWLPGERDLSLRQTNLGQILVSAKGRTLYLFMKDTNGRSACSGSCVTYWPPLVNTGKLTVGPGVKRSLVGTTKRPDGRLQVTYNKHPLYTFALDTRAGQTKGQGTSNFGANWYAVSARGRAVLKAPTTTTTDTTTTTTTYPSYP